MKTRIVVTLAYDYTTKGRYTRLARLVVNRVPRGATVKATCKKGCSRKSYTKRNVRGGNPGSDQGHIQLPGAAWKLIRYDYRQLRGSTGAAPTLQF